MPAAVAPSLDTQPIPPRFERIALDRLRPSPNNPRRIKDNDPSLTELAESLRTLGQIEPIVVQELPDDAYRFEILAGERRWRAAKIAGLKEIEAKVMALSEQQALEVTVVENLQRQDLDPLSEARGVATLLSKGWDVATIASHLGKSTRWVHLRSGLTKLTQAWTDAMTEPTSIVARFSAGHLELVARLTADQQDAVLHQVDKLAKEWDGSVVSVDDFADTLANKFTHDLSAARFDVRDAGLVLKAGACTACPKRSSCQLELFSDLAIPKNGKKPIDHCLDAQCWERKDAAWLKAQEKIAREQHGDQLVKIDPEKYYGSAKVLGESEFAKAKPEAKGAVPALIVGDGADAGKTIWVKPKVSRTAGVEPKDEAKEQAKREREKIERDRQDFIADSFLTALQEAKLPDDETLIRLAAVSMESWDNETKRAFDPKVKTDTLRKELWEVICQRVDGDGCEAALCKLAGVDHADLVAAAAAKFPDVSEGVAEAKAPKAAKKAKAAKKTTTKKVAKKAKKKGAA